MSTLIAAIVNFIILICVPINTDKYWHHLIPAFIGGAIFLQGIRHLRFQTGIPKLIRIIGVAIAAFTSGFSYLCLLLKF